MSFNYLNIIYPSDLLGSKVGGAESFLKGLIKHCPANIKICYYGLNNRTAIDLKSNFGNEYNNVSEYLAVLNEENENRKTFIPLSLRYTLALKKFTSRISPGVHLFNRIEPAILFSRSPHPKIVIIHNDIQKQIYSKKSEVFWSKLPWIYKKMEKRIFEFVDEVYTVSQSTLDFYLKNYPEYKNKFHFIPTWVDPKVFHLPSSSRRNIKEILSKDTGLNPDRKWLLFVGRFQEQKAPERLIEVFKKFQTTGLDSQLILIGEGNLKSNLEKMVRDVNLSDRVRFFPAMNQSALEKFYQASDAFLLLSHFEGMPMSVLEALSCGLPVVSTDVGEVRRVVRSGFSGELLREYKPDLAVEYLEQIFSNPARYDSKNCIESVSDYTPEKVLKPLYAKIMELSKVGFNK